MKSFLHKQSTLIILFISGISNFLDLYVSLFENDNYDLSQVIILSLISVFGGVLTSILLASIFWFSIPLYEYLSNKTNQYQKQIPFQVFLIIVAIINIICFFSKNETFCSVFYSLNGDL